MIPYFDEVATILYREIIHDQNSNAVIQVRPINLKTTNLQRDLGPDDIDKLVQVQGIIIRCGSIIPEIKDAHFRCVNCNFRVFTPVFRQRIEQPNECEVCKSKSSFQIVHNMSTFGDKQHVKMQESQENVPDGETPHHIQLVAFEEHVDYVRPGD